MTPIRYDILKELPHGIRNSNLYVSVELFTITNELKPIIGVHLFFISQHDGNKGIAILGNLLIHVLYHVASKKNII